MNHLMRKALLTRFKPPAWAVFFEVGNATGARCSRHADAVAMSIWPSRGLEVIGIEVKASRTDWVRERDNPAKAESVMKFCDRWYLAVTDEKIVQAGELPATWGQLTLKGGKLMATKEAPKLEPEPLTKSFVAAMLRRAAEDRPGAEEIAEKVRDAVKEAREEDERHRAWEGKHARAHLKELTEQVSAFELASGISITRYVDGQELGETVKAVYKLTNAKGTRSTMNRVRAEAQTLRDAADQVEAIAKSLEAMLTSKQEQPA